MKKRRKTDETAPLTAMQYLNERLATEEAINNFAKEFIRRTGHRVQFGIMFEPYTQGRTPNSVEVE